VSYTANKMRGVYPKTGTVLLGKYRVESIIGEGGMGGVLKATHVELDEPVAIKVLLPDMMNRAEIVQRFMREAKAAVKLKGEHVARVIDVGKLEGDADGRLEGTPYIVMEYLDGADLAAILKHHGPQEPAMAVDLILQACEALAEAHSLGIIHRDIKTSNFYITQDVGDPPHLKVLDFGLATTPQGTSELTDGGAVIGTPAYMSPEQMRSSRLADARSDIWSLGVVLYEMLEGARPFFGQAYSDLCLKVGMDPPEPMVQPNVPEALREIVMRCLEKTIERRYQSVAELAFDLIPFASEPDLARASVEQTTRLLSRRGALPRMTSPAMRSEPISTQTPSSLQAGNGEQLSTPPSQSVSPSQVQRSKKQRGLIIGASFVAAIVLAGIGVFAFGGDKKTVAPAKAPTPAPDTSVSVDPKPAPKPEPQPEPKPEPKPDVQPEVQPEPAGSGSAVASNETIDKPAPKKNPKIIRKVVKKVPKGDDDPYAERR
jgi:eukaryotic-like serine/threonine-protein kinase